MKSVSLSLLMAFTLAVPSAQAAHGVGNGGMGVRVNDHLRLLDLVEAGIPNIMPGIKPTPESFLVPRLDQAFKSFGGAMSGGLSQTEIQTVREFTLVLLEELSKYDPVTAASIVVAMNMYTWRIVD